MRPPKNPDETAEEKEQRLKGYQTKYKTANRARINEQERKRRKNNPAPFRAANAAYHLRNAKKISARKRAYYEKHPFLKRAYKLRRRYGLTIEQWESIFDSQGRSCAICRSALPGGSGWHTDHCHESRRVRGILCAKCNLGLGAFREQPDLLLKANSYLAKLV